MLEINDKGLVTERLNVILSRLSESMRKIYGNDIYIDPDSEDGQQLGIYAQGLADMNEAIASVYQMSDPTKAVGVWLDVALKYVGSRRTRAKYSYLNNVEINTQIGTILPIGYTIVDDNRNEWIITAPISATTTKTHAQFRSSSYGAFNLEAGAPLKAKTIVLGVGVIKSTIRSELGNLQESDPAALARFLRSYQQNNINDVQGLEGALLALNDVRDVLVYENYTDTIDSRGVTGHTINTVIVGGEDRDIAETIILKKTMGCGLQGLTEYTLFYRDMDRKVNFDRAERVDVRAKVTVIRRNTGIDVDVEEIKKSVSENSFLINEDVIAGSLYCGVNNAAYKVKSVTLSTTTESDVLIIPIGLRQYAAISADDVEVSIE